MEERMKYTILFLFLLVISTHAQDSFSAIQFNVGLGSPSVPTDFSDYWNSSINFGAGYSHYFNSSISIQGNVEYDLFTLDDETLLTDAGLNYQGYTLDGGNVSSLFMSADFQFNIISVTHRFSPYILAGIGFIHTSIADATLSDGYSSADFPGGSENAFGFDLGAGLQLNVAANFSIYGEVRYIRGLTKKVWTDTGWSDDDKTAYVPIKLGGMFWF
jgi:hypothetical protein